MLWVLICAVHWLFLDPGILGIRVCPSVLPSVLLSGILRGIGSLTFSETYDVRAYGDVHDRARFFWKNPPPVKMTKNGPKLGFLDFLGKSVHQFLTGNCVEWKYYDPLTFCKNCISWINLVLKVLPKMLLTNQISIVFNCQYLINGLVSDWFLACREILFLGKQAIFGLKTARPYNFGSVLRIFFEVLHNERDPEVHGNHSSNFSERILFKGKLARPAIKFLDPL